MIDPEVRRLGIGGSDVGALFNCDEYRDAFSVWMEKKGGLEKAVTRNIRMVVGHMLETGVLGLYTYVTGRKVQYCNITSRHPKRPWMIYTPDGLVEGERRGVDAKVVFWDQRKHWGATANDIPYRVQLQCFWYMAAMDYDLWDVAVLMGEGEPRVYTIERDREAERAMLAYVEWWYRTYLVGNERPPLGASDDAARWLQQTFPTHKRPDLRAATDEEITLLNEYAGLRVSLRDLDQRKKILETMLKAAIADKEGLTWIDGKFTWRRTKDSKITDWESLAWALLTHYVEDEKGREELLERYTRIKPGSRRIWIDSDLLRDTADAA